MIQEVLNLLSKLDATKVEKNGTCGQTGPLNLEKFAAENCGP